MHKNHFQDYLSNFEWLLVEHSYDETFFNINESQFALGNGYLGSRSVFEELPKGSQPGTFFNGIYDPSASKVSELVNAPNPFNLSISIPREEKLDISTMHVEKHKRILDLNKGLLVRNTVYRGHDNKLYDYQSIRFISMDNPHIAIMKIALTPLSKDTKFLVDSTVDTSVKNHGNLFESDTRHFHIQEASHLNGINYISVRTLAHDISISYADKMQINTMAGEKTIRGNKFEIKLRKNETLFITKYFSFTTSKDIADARKIKGRTVKLLRNHSKKGFDTLLSKHCSAFQKKWNISDITIAGDQNLQASIRFNIYHLIIMTGYFSKKMGIPAKTLSGEGYRGHIFWESEVYALPFYIFTNPKMAREILEYRYERLDLAKEIADSEGYKGAKFPWESAETGLDETPIWTKDYDGSIKIVHTKKQAQHITADIYYGIYLYFQATHDYEFMLNKGIKIILEMAMFWETRASFNKKDGFFEIRKIMGPDEFHDSINNNAFTNILVAWELKTTVALISSLKKIYPAKINNIISQYNINENKMLCWLNIASGLEGSCRYKGKILEQFQGYFQLRKPSRIILDQNGLPRLPADIDLKDLRKTQYIKQADVIMLLHLLPELFDIESVKENYCYYEKRTLHKSSLSPSAYSTIAVQLGFFEQANRYRNIALNMDLKNLYGNTPDGVHTSGIGGAWQVIIYGYCGARIINDCLVLYPQLPLEWRQVRFHLYYLGNQLSITVEQDQIHITAKNMNRYSWKNKLKYHKKYKRFNIKIYDRDYLIKQGKTYCIPIEKNKKRSYYEITNYSKSN